MLDPQDEAYDRRLAHHLVSLYYQSEEQMEEEFLDMAVLRDYIAYARTYINPRLSEEASQALIEVRERMMSPVPPPHGVLNLHPPPLRRPTWTCVRSAAGEGWSRPTPASWSP